MTAWSSLFYPLSPQPGLDQIRLFEADVTRLMGILSNKYRPGVKKFQFRVKKDLPILTMERKCVQYL